jgi:16S rRNA processing protein RimM
LKSSSNENAGKEWVLIATITGAHGIQGAVKAQSYAESNDLFGPGRRLKAEANDGRQYDLTVQWARAHARGTRLAFQEIKDRSQAEALAGARLFIDRGCLPELEEDTYYWFDIIGLSVFDTQGEFLGRVESILPTGSNDVYLVRKGIAGKEREILIPALASVILHIDLKSRRMRVNLPEEA